MVFVGKKSLMSKFQRPKKKSRPNATSSQSSHTYGPKPIHSVQRQVSSAKPPTQLDNPYHLPQPTAIQRQRNLEHPEANINWNRSNNPNMLHRSLAGGRTHVHPELMLSHRKPSQRKSMEQLQQSLPPKRWDREPMQPRGSNNVMQLKAAARMPWDSLQPMRMDGVVQRDDNDPPDTTTVNPDTDPDTTNITVDNNNTEVDNETDTTDDAVSDRSRSNTLDSTNNASNSLVPPNTNNDQERQAASTVGVGVSIGMGTALAQPEIDCQFPNNPPEYQQEGNQLVQAITNTIDDGQGSEYYKISFSNNMFEIVCPETSRSDVLYLLQNSSMMADRNPSVTYDGLVPNPNSVSGYDIDDEYVTISASVKLSHFNLDPVSQGRLQVSGDFNGTPAPPVANAMGNELTGIVKEILGRQLYSGVSAQIHRSTQSIQVMFTGDDATAQDAMERLRTPILVTGGNGLAYKYRNIFKTGKIKGTKVKDRFFKPKKQGSGLFSRSQSNQPNQQSTYVLSLKLRRPTDWQDIMTQVGNAGVTLAYTDATNIAQEQALNNDQAYTVLDRFKMMLQVMKGQGDNVPEDVSELVGSSSSLSAWSIPGFSLVAVINKFLNICTYSKKRKRLRQSFEQSQQDIDALDRNAGAGAADRDATRTRLMKLQEATKYGIHKMKKLIVTLWIDAIATLVQLISRIFTLLFPQIAVGTIFVDVAALAVKLGSLLYRKAKGLVKHFKGTRGKQRFASAEAIYNSAVAGDNAGLTAIRALGMKTLMTKVGTWGWTNVKKGGKGIGTLAAYNGRGIYNAGRSLRGKQKINNSSPTVRLNKNGLDSGLNDKAKKEMQWGKWPSEDSQLRKMLANAGQVPGAKTVFLKSLSNSLKSSL